MPSPELRALTEAVKAVSALVKTRQPAIQADTDLDEIEEDIRDARPINDLREFDR